MSPDHPLAYERQFLEWALWLAQSDARTWQQGDLHRAIEGLATVQPIAATWISSLAREVVDDRGQLDLLQRSPSSKKDRRKWFYALQKGFKEIIEEVGVLRQKMKDEGMIDGLTLAFTGTCTYRIQLHDFDHLQPVFMPPSRHTPKDFITALQLQLADSLSRIDLSRLKRCPQCDRLFLAVHKQRFDTLQCSNRFRMRLGLHFGYRWQGLLTLHGRTYRARHCPGALPRHAAIA